MHICCSLILILTIFRKFCILNSSRADHSSISFKTSSCLYALFLIWLVVNSLLNINTFLSNTSSWSSLFTLISCTITMRSNISISSELGIKSFICQNRTLIMMIKSSKRCSKSNWLIDLSYKFLLDFLVFAFRYSSRSHKGFLFFRWLWSYVIHIWF